MAAPLKFGEWRPDASDINGTHSNVIQNVLPRSDGYGPVKSVEEMTEALPSPCRGYFFARKADGSIQIFAGTATRLYTLDNTTFAWADISKDGAAYPALDATAQWQFCQFNNFIIAVQANTVPQVYDITSSTAFADLGGNPPQAAYIAVINRFVVLSGLASYPYRIQWSGLNAATTWTSGVNSSDYQDLPDGGRTKGVVGGELGIIMQDSAIRRMIFSAGSSTIFQIDRLGRDIGAIAPYTVVNASERIFFLSAKGFMQIDAEGALTTIGKERVDRTFFADYDETQSHLVMGAVHPTENIVFFTYKSKASSDDTAFDRLLAYDYLLDRWTPIAMSGQFLSSLARPGITLEGLDSVGDLDALSYPLDNFSAATLAQISIVTPDNRLGYFTGPNLEARLGCSEQSAIAQRIFVRGFHPITDAPDVFGKVGKRENLKTASVFTPESRLNAQGFVPLRASTRYARAQIRIPAGTDWTFATAIVPDYVQEGKR